MEETKENHRRTGENRGEEQQRTARVKLKENCKIKEL